MSNRKIRSIVCAVRGNLASRNTATRAIDLALEHQARVTFVYFVEADFLVKASLGMSSMRSVLAHLQEMGEFTMMLLVDRANRRGVTNADFIVRQGSVVEQLPRLLGELQSETLVIGKPVSNSEIPVFTPESFAEFIEKIEKDHDISIEQVDHNS